MHGSFARFLEWLYYSDAVVCSKGCRPSDMVFKFALDDQILQVRLVRTPTYKVQLLADLMQGCNMSAIQRRIEQRLDECQSVLEADHSQIKEMLTMLDDGEVKESLQKIKK